MQETTNAVGSWALSSCYAPFGCKGPQMASYQPLVLASRVAVYLKGEKLRKLFKEQSNWLSRPPPHKKEKIQICLTRYVLSQDVIKWTFLSTLKLLSGEEYLRAS